MRDLCVRDLCVRDLPGIACESGRWSRRAMPISRDGSSPDARTVEGDDHSRQEDSRQESDGTSMLYLLSNLQSTVPPPPPLSDRLLMRRGTRRTRVVPRVKRVACGSPQDDASCCKRPRTADEDMEKKTDGTDASRRRRLSHMRSERGVCVRAGWGTGVGRG